MVTDAVKLARERKLGDTPRKYRGMMRRAWSGRSRLAAIRAACVECMGWDAIGVTDCTSLACPLYAYRLLSPVARAKAAGDVEVEE